VEVSNDEVSLCEVNAGTETAQEDSAAATNHKESEEAKSVDHGSLEGDRPLVQSSGPVEDLHCGGHCDQHDKKEKTRAA
jgi:hypothetical protein